MNRKILRIAIVFIVSMSFPLAGKDTGIYLWQIPPWLKEFPCQSPEYRAMMPADSALAQMADGEYESVAISVENRTGEICSYTVDTSALAAAVPGLSVDVSSSWVTPIARIAPDAAVLKAMMSAPKYPPNDVGDPLLPVGKGRRLFCPAGENRTFWLTLHTRGAKPGVYQAPVKIITGSGTTKILHFTLQVWPFTLPENLDIICYHWDYGNHPAALQDMKEHKVNTFMFEAFPKGLRIRKDGSISWELDLDRIEDKRDVVPYAKFIGSYGFFDSYIKWAQENKIPYMSDKFKSVFIQAVRHMAGELKRIGLDYSQYYVQHIDEAHGAQAKQVVDLGALAHEADPNIRWFLTQMSSPEEIKAMAPYTQMMGKRGEAYWSASEREWYEKKYRAGGGKIIQFKQVGMYRGNPDVHTMNRLRPWRTWLNRWDGMCTFVYSSCVYNPYTRPVATRHWEAIREGNEDYQYFTLFRDLAEKKGERERAVAEIDGWIRGLIGPTAPGTAMIYVPEDREAMLQPYRIRAAAARKIAALKGIATDRRPEYTPPQPAEFRGERVLLKPAVVRSAYTSLDEVSVNLTLSGKDRQGKTARRTYPLDFSMDDYGLDLAGLLTPGERYRFSLEYSCPADKSPLPKLIISGIAEHFFCRKSDGLWNSFQTEFTVPSGTTDLNLILKEIRNMNGRNIVNRVELRNIALERLTPGGNAFPELRQSVQHENPEREIKPEEQLVSYRASLKRGFRYLLEFRYRSDIFLPGGAAVRLDRMLRKNQRDIFISSLSATGGKWVDRKMVFDSDLNGSVLIQIGPADFVVATSPEGERRAPEFAVEKIRLTSLGAEPLRERVSRYCRHLEKIRSLVRSFSPDDPLFKLVQQEEKQREKMKKLLSGLKPTGRDTSGEILRMLTDWEKNLGKYPYGISVAPAGKNPPLENSGIPMKKGRTGGIQKFSASLPSEPVCIGITNFSASPLCFMMKENNISASVSGVPDANADPAFKRRFGWRELVIPPCKTAFLTVSMRKKAGKFKHALELGSMDRYIPDLQFDFHDGRQR